MSRKRDERQLRALEEQCREIAGIIKNTIPPWVGFFLCLFDFGEGGWSTYMSNGQRADMVKHLRELADRLEGAPYEPKGAGGSSEPGGEG